MLSGCRICAEPVLVKGNRCCESWCIGRYFCRQTQCISTTASLSLGFKLGTSVQLFGSKWEVGLAKCPIPGWFHVDGSAKSRRKSIHFRSSRGNQPFSPKSSADLDVFGDDQFREHQRPSNRTQYLQGHANFAVYWTIFPANFVFMATNFLAPLRRDRRKGPVGCLCDRQDEILWMVHSWWYWRSLIQWFRSNSNELGQWWAPSQCKSEAANQLLNTSQFLISV